MILIITSNSTLRIDLFKYLQEREYAVCFPEHRHNAIGLVEQYHPEVIVLDLYISQPNGLTLLQDLRTHGFSGKVLVLSGTSNRNLTPDIHRNKVDQIISYSPTTAPDLLLDQIESMIRGFFRKKISERAFEHFTQSGGCHGHDLDHWLMAEKEVLQTLRRPVMTS